MSDYNYSKISRISFSASSSGMMMGSNKSVSEEVLWQKDGSVVLKRTEINGFTKEESTWNLSPEQAEEIRAAAEKIDMASWGELEYEEDPRFRCTDYSSHAGGSIFLDYRDLGGKPFEMVHFDRRAVFAANKDGDLKMMEDLFAKIEDPEKRANYEKSNTQNSGAPTMGGFVGMMGMGADTGSGISGAMGLGMMNLAGGKNPLVPEADGGDGTNSDPENSDTLGSEKPDEGDTWTCSCGTKNSGMYCGECGMRRPQ
ncbi:MAG: hypothetical protein J5379_02865 [Clostridiales bacterium]|nr:hypothetical protein [Clostridiales bacterium]